MRGIVVEEPGGPALVVDDLEVEEPRGGVVLVKIEHCALCHSDVTVQNSATAGHPVALGHEAAGRVEALGSGVSGISVGDPVVLAVAPACGLCVFCVRGEASLCVETSVVLRGVFPDESSRLTRQGELVRRGVGLGAFAERIVVSRSAVVVVDSTHHCIWRVCWVVGWALAWGLCSTLRLSSQGAPCSSRVWAGLAWPQS